MKREFFIPLLLACIISVKGQSQCACDSLWQEQTTAEFVNLFERSTKDTSAIWGDYYVGKGFIVLEAGLTNDDKYCLGAWKDGRNIAYFCPEDRPKMLTPLYTYYLDFPSVDTASSHYGLVKVKNESPDFNSWMESLNAKTAVYLPTNFPDLGFEIPPIKKVQLAIHESFHTEVQFPQWFTNNGYWPTWDKQPNRKEVNECYTASDEVASLVKNELRILSNMIEALLDDNKSKATVFGAEFIDTREKRYKLLERVPVHLANGSLGDCKTAESIMELEEGLADWASWTQLYNIGLVSKAELLKRYRAQQNEPFYLFGNMLMHAIELMDGNSSNIIHKIIASESVAEGALLNAFKNQLIRYSQK